jgi:hypothetical protein
MPKERKPDKDEAAAYARMEAATLELRRREYRETTPGERIEQIFELAEFANELQDAVSRAKGKA